VITSGHRAGHRHVVDDAIVVVENVERVNGGRHPYYRRDATKLACRRSPHPSLPSPLVLLSVFCAGAFIPGISGEVFRHLRSPLSCRDVLSAINALTLSQPSARALAKKGITDHAAASWHCDGSIEQSVACLCAWWRDYVRLSVSGWRWLLRRGSIAGLVPAHADRVSRRGRSRRILGLSIAGGASVILTAEVVLQAESIVFVDERRSMISLRRGLNFIDSYSQANAGFHGRHAKPFEGRRTTVRSL